MTIFENAKHLREAGWSDEQIRRELRGGVLSCGEPPTCSAVEDAIRRVNGAKNRAAMGNMEHRSHDATGSDTTGTGDAVVRVI